MDEAWFDALTLSERVASCNSAELQQLSTQPVTGVGRFRYNKWRKVGTFTQSTDFAQRLAKDNLSEPQFVGILSEPLGQLKTRTPNLNWVTALKQRYTTCQTPSLTSTAQQARLDETLLVIVRPLIYSILNDLYDAYATTAAHLGQAAFPETALSLWVTALLDDCDDILTPIVVTELQSARFLKQLSGETSQARFQSFLDLYRSAAGALTLLKAYPVLGRLLHDFTTNWLAARVEFLDRLAADWSTLTKTFFTDSAPAIQQIQDSVSDRHDSGRTVYILHDSNGARLLYKPKPLTVDAQFQTLLNWFNQHGQGQLPPLRLLTIVERPAYGWVEFVTHESCLTSGEVAQFYERLGALLAILYLVRGTDFHSDNVIASGAHPILIDLEGLFHPDIPDQTDDLSEAEQQAYARFYSSVITTLLLPNIRPNQFDDAADGGLGGNATKLALRLKVLDAQSDQMRYEQIWVSVAGDEAQNRPKFNQTQADPTDYIDQIEQGFRTAYRIAQNNQAALRQQLSTFAGARIRFLFRDTMIYDMLLRQLRQPDQLRRGLTQERTLDLLWGRVNQGEQYANFIADEKRELRTFDVPYFYTQADSRDVWASSGKRFSQVTDRSGLDAAMARVDAISDRGCREQLWYIRATLACSSTRENSLTPPAPSKRTQSPLELACAIGDKLAAQAVDDGTSLAWISVSSYRHRHYVGPNNLTLYSGSCGIALFFAALARVTNNVRWENLARKTIAPLQATLANTSSIEAHLNGTLLGAYDGIAGYITTCARLGQQFDDPALLSQAHAWATLSSHKIDSDGYLNVLSGTAGLIPALWCLNEIDPSEDLLAYAVQAGERLLQQLQPCVEAWQLPTHVRLGTGYASGLIGIAAELYRVAQWAGQPRFAIAANQLLEHVPAMPTATNWHDGAIGYALGWLSLPPEHRTVQASNLIDQAIRQVSDAEIRDHSLANGLFGSLDFLHTSAEILADPILQHTTEQLAAQHLANLTIDAIQCGLPLAVEAAGLIQGLAGIGYGLVRYIAPSKLPSLLTVLPLVRAA